jgi:antitoxin ParD1/3/4
MPTRNVNLTDRLERFIEAGVASGRFSDASEVVREGLRLLEQREAEDQAKLAWLRGAVQKGLDEIDRGDGIEFDSVEELGTLVGQIGAEAEAEFQAKQNRA